LSQSKNVIQVLGKIRKHLDKLGAFGYGPRVSFTSGQMRNVAYYIYINWKHLGKVNQPNQI